MKPNILSFGEIIWDIYDTESYIGGAGLNFAAHCSRCGAGSFLFSAVGNDELGKKAADIISGFNINQKFIKHSDKVTGQCIVQLDAGGTPDFNVLADTAYDNIAVSDDDISYINEIGFDALYFGTLIQRSPASRAALRKICGECSFREIVCDLNLRKNCYDSDSVKFCLENATILKISSEDELLLREFNLYSAGADSYKDISEAICAVYKQIKYVILTLGEKGAFVYCAESKKHFVKKAKSVKVVSAVGAGDSFIAAWITSYLSGRSVELSTEHATALSGFVVSQADAIPEYTTEVLFMNNQPKLQAHRGVSTEYPENTMAAFDAAIRQGYDVIELDPDYTADNKLVVLHDKTLNRTARNKDGSLIEEPVCIRDITYSRALEYDCCIGQSGEFKGEKIPLLEQVLKLAKENDIIIKIDNKIEAFPKEITELLYSLLKEFEPWVAITTGKVEMIKFYAEKFPEAQLHYDGAVDENALHELSAYSDRLTVWLPYESEKFTWWVKVPYADKRLCSMVRECAKLGIWIINDYESYEYICENFAPDIVETTGAVKPATEYRKECKI
ncbi:MAG: hypothetical protein IJ365_03115 [Clostridia bacterium]|nr:hypothetical protein [Clostridia bacterium]